MKHKAVIVQAFTADFVFRRDIVSVPTEVERCLAKTDSQIKVDKMGRQRKGIAGGYDFVFEFDTVVQYTVLRNAVMKSYRVVNHVVLDEDFFQRAAELEKRRHQRFYSR